MSKVNLFPSKSKGQTTSSQRVDIPRQDFVLERNDRLGIVQTNYFHFAVPPNELILESGEKIGPVTVLMRPMEN